MASITRKINADGYFAGQKIDPQQLSKDEEKAHEGFKKIAFYYQKKSPALANFKTLLERRNMELRTDVFTGSEDSEYLEYLGKLGVFRKKIARINQYHVDLKDLIRRVESYKGENWEDTVLWLTELKDQVAGIHWEMKNDWAECKGLVDIFARCIGIRVKTPMRPKTGQFKKRSPGPRSGSLCSSSSAQYSLTSSASSPSSFSSSSRASSSFVSQQIPPATSTRGLAYAPLFPIAEEGASRHGALGGSPNIPVAQNIDIGGERTEPPSYLEWLLSLFGCCSKRK